MKVLGPILTVLGFLTLVGALRIVLGHMTGLMEGPVWRALLDAGLTAGVGFGLIVAGKTLRARRSRQDRRRPRDADRFPWE
jgi:hypothetical protein